MRRDDDARVEEVAGRKMKRPYVKPQLEKYGSVAKLTQSGGSTKSETGPISLTGPCL
jgi:hypothetical protein